MVWSTRSCITCCLQWNGFSVKSNVCVFKQRAALKIYKTQFLLLLPRLKLLLCCINFQVILYNTMKIFVGTLFGSGRGLVSGTLLKRGFLTYSLLFYQEFTSKSDIYFWKMYLHVLHDKDHTRLKWFINIARELACGAGTSAASATG